MNGKSIKCTLSVCSSIVTRYSDIRASASVSGAAIINLSVS